MIITCLIPRSTRTCLKELNRRGCAETVGVSGSQHSNVHSFADFTSITSAVRFMLQQDVRHLFNNLCSKKGSTPFVLFLILKESSNARLSYDEKQVYVVQFCRSQRKIMWGDGCCPQCTWKNELNKIYLMHHKYWYVLGWSMLQLWAKQTIWNNSGSCEPARWHAIRGKSDWMTDALVID